MDTIYVGLFVSAMFVFQCGSASSSTIHEIECRPVSVSYQENNDSSTRQTISGPDIERYLSASTPKGCEFSVFHYGGGLWDLQDPPKKCMKAYAAAGASADDFWKLAYPLKYKISGKEIRFGQKISVSDDEFGVINVVLSATYNLDNMILRLDSKATSKLSHVALFMNFTLQCR